MSKEKADFFPFLNYKMAFIKKYIIIRDHYNKKNWLIKAKWPEFLLPTTTTSTNQPPRSLMNLIFAYFLLLTVNSYICSNLPFTTLITLIKKNHQQKGLSLLSIKFFVLALIVFSSLNAMFTVIMNTSEFTQKSAIKSAWLVLLSIRIVLGVVLMVFLFVIEDNESEAGDKEEQLVLDVSFQRERSNEEKHTI